MTRLTASRIRILYTCLRDALAAGDKAAAERIANRIAQILEKIDAEGGSTRVH